MDVGEVSDAVRRHGERYLRRVYTDRELHDCGERPRPLAARFAAKEAVIKALGAADVASPWRSIGVRHARGSRDRLELTGAVEAHAQRHGVASLSLSIGHNSRCAVAIVLARFTDDRRPEL